MCNGDDTHSLGEAGQPSETMFIKGLAEVVTLE